MLEASGAARGIQGNELCSDAISITKAANYNADEPSLDRKVQEDPHQAAQRYALLGANEEPIDAGAFHKETPGCVPACRGPGTI
jgi:hypothetical protein